MTAEEQYKQIIETIKAQVSAPGAENYFPIFNTEIEQHSGIRVTGTFETDDDSATGNLSYVSVLRNADSLDPADGFGFAWRKGDGSQYNIYVVDNNALTDDLFVNENIIMQSTGENSFLKAAKLAIAINTKYNFRMDISQSYAIDIWIWADGSTEPDFNNSSTRTINAGPFELGPRSDGTHFGMSVLGTKGSQWWYGDLQVSTTVGIHTAVLFKLKADPVYFPNNRPATVKYYGYGNDNGTYGLDAYLLTKSGSEWEWVKRGTNTSTSGTLRSNTMIPIAVTMSGIYRDDDNFVNVLVTTPTATNVVSAVDTYYVSLENTIPSGIHTGGKADIYVNDPSKIVVAERTINNTDGKVTLNAANGFYFPIMNIISISISATGEAFTENQDWVLVNNDAGATYSTRENSYISISPSYVFTKVKVIYRYYQNGQSIQTILDSDDYRYSGADNLAKIMPPIIVTINKLDYRGPASELEVKAALKAYINEATDYISISDVLTTVYDLKSTYINTSTVDITYREFDHVRSYTDPATLVDTLTLPTRRAFFIDDKEMTGVTRL